MRGKLDNDFFIWLDTRQRGSFTLDQNDRSSTSVTCMGATSSNGLYAAALSGLLLRSHAKSIRAQFLLKKCLEAWINRVIVDDFYNPNLHILIKDLYHSYRIDTRVEHFQYHPQKNLTILPSGQIDQLTGQADPVEW